MSDRVKAHGWRDMGTVQLPMMKDTITRSFMKGPCYALVSQENHVGRMRWHLSISCSNRYPGWEEIKDARYALLPVGLTFAQVLPPLTEYLNVHPNCFHLWEIGDGEW